MIMLCKLCKQYFVKKKEADNIFSHVNKPSGAYI